MSDEPKEVYNPIKLAGHINWAHERGSYPGCKVVKFTNNTGYPLDEQINDYFETKEHAALVVDIKPLGQDSCLVFYTKRLTEDEQAEMKEFNSHYAEWKEEKKLKKLEAEEKIRKAIANKNAQEAKDRAFKEKQFLLLCEVAVKHLQNCKKNKKEAQEALETILEWKRLKTERDAPVVVDPLPKETNLG